MRESVRCVFPSCAAFGTPVDAIKHWCCARCGRPLGGVPFGPGPGFVIERWLGSGYYADVFQVAEVQTGASFAAKLYADTAAQRRAADCEIAALQALAHPRLPAFRAWFEAGPWRCVVMELVEGINLRDIVETAGTLTVERVVKLGGEACEALAAIADAGWTYRDLHPKNLHPFTPKGTMLLDFDNARPPHTPAALAGRAGYRAPELDWGGAVSPACDVFGLAGCLYFALVGDDPPERPGPLPDLRLRLGAAANLASLLDACRAAEPARRPHANAVRAALSSRPLIGD